MLLWVLQYKAPFRDIAQIAGSTTAFIYQQNHPLIFKIVLKENGKSFVKASTIHFQNT